MSSLNWFRQLDPISCFFVQTDSQCSKPNPAVGTNCFSVSRLDIVFWGTCHLKGKRLPESCSFCFSTGVSMPYSVKSVHFGHQACADMLETCCPYTRIQCSEQPGQMASHMYRPSSPANCSCTFSKIL